MITSPAYVGIGARTTPPAIRKTMREIARRLAVLGFVLRSGGATGADQAFERGCDIVSGPKEIFLPWKEFNENMSEHYEIPGEAFAISEKLHPKGPDINNWTHVRKLMARNVQQVLGKNLDNPSLFVLCWTQDGAECTKRTSVRTGGTGQAIRVACENKIPVFNLYNPEAEERLTQFQETFGF